jgi:hypothetical protein
MPRDKPGHDREQQKGRIIDPVLYATLGPNVRQQELQKSLQHRGLPLVVAPMRPNMSH